MNKVIVMTHGDLADHLVETLELFVGKSEHVSALDLREEPEKMREKLSALLLEGEKADFLLLVDLFGGTPFNIAAPLISQARGLGRKVELISGVNLPMLMDVVPNIEYSTLEELKSAAYEMGRYGIRDLMAELQQGNG